MRDPIEPELRGRRTRMITEIFEVQAIYPGVLGDVISKLGGSATTDELHAELVGLGYLRTGKPVPPPPGERPSVFTIQDGDE
ncbi:MAG: hypothetical protein H0W63_03960 [Gemmatimonadaceae bacterium]|nr:hypothetical protein [Gemmatimonadaceae bacterium]